MGQAAGPPEPARSTAQGAPTPGAQQERVHSLSLIGCLELASTEAKPRPPVTRGGAGVDWLSTPAVTKIPRPGLPANDLLSFEKNPHLS